MLKTSHKKKTNCRLKPCLALLMGVGAFHATPTELRGADDRIEAEVAREREEQVSKPSPIDFHGILYMMGWVGWDTNYAFIYDRDSYLQLGYKWTNNSKVVIDLKLADILKPTNVWADTEIYGQVDILESIGIKDYGLIVKLGKMNLRHEYFGEYAMGIGKDFIADKRVNSDMLNWNLIFTTTKIPFELSFMSDLDFGHRKASTWRDFSDWNDSGFSLMTEARLRDMVLSPDLKFSVSLFHDEIYHVNAKKAGFTPDNRDWIDPNNSTRYLGGTSRLLIGLGNSSISLGGAVKYFSEKTKGTTTVGEVETPVKTHNQGVDFEAGVWYGNFSIADFRFAYQQVKESQANSQKTIGVEFNVYMIPKISIYGGVAFALEPDIVNFGKAHKTPRSRYGWDIGVIYTPITGVLLTTGWQKMVRWDDYGYYYIKATFWW